MSKGLRGFCRGFGVQSFLTLWNLPQFVHRRPGHQSEADGSRDSLTATLEIGVTPVPPGPGARREDRVLE